MKRMDLHPAAARTPNPTPDDEQLLASARRALAIEARAVEALTARLGARVRAGVPRLPGLPRARRGHRHGQSGHVAGKIAATLASTGTPAFFLHPAEAGHGDLGMITRVDAVLALSNSGETPELVLLLPHLKRLAVPLIVMTGKTDSKLGLAASVTLDVGVSEEACPLNLAPTASTTATLAMGDALAVAVLEARGFTPAGFRALPPRRRTRQKAAAACRGPDAHRSGRAAGRARRPLERRPDRDVAQGSGDDGGGRS